MNDDRPDCSNGRQVEDSEFRLRDTSPACRPTAAPEPFNAAAFRLTDGPSPAAGVRQVLTSVPVQKPAKDVFVRVRPGDDHRLTATALEFKREREAYLVDRTLIDNLADESTVSRRLLVTAVTRDGDPFIGPLRQPDPDGRLDEWGVTALDAAARAERSWIRVSADLRAGCYKIREATAPSADPEWLDLPFGELLRLAFRGQVMRDLDHPMLKHLRGEA